jgi:hypothetical protein
MVRNLDLFNLSKWTPIAKVRRITNIDQVKYTDYDQEKQGSPSRTLMLGGSRMLPWKVYNKMLEKGQRKTLGYNRGLNCFEHPCHNGNNFVSSCRFIEGAMVNVAINQYFFSNHVQLIPPLYSGVNNLWFILISLEVHSQIHIFSRSHIDRPINSYFWNIGHAPNRSISSDPSFKI